MQTIRGLIVDDYKKNIDWLTGCFDAEFEQYDWRIVWERLSAPRTAQRLIRTAAQPFDFAVVDLLFFRDDLPQETECLGLDLISEIRAHSDRTFIFAISGGDQKQPDLFDRAKRKGAHHTAHRAQFKSDSVEHSPSAVCAEIREFLLNNGSVTEVEVRADAHDPAIQSILHEVGQQTVAQLYTRILAAYRQRSEKIEVGFLTPGTSGAWVCWVTAEAGVIDASRHVLKLSRARENLHKEAEKAVFAGRVISPRFFVRHNPEHPVGEVNGWYALGSQLLDQASTLHSWLAAGPDPKVVDDVVETLLLEALKPMYDHHTQQVDHCALTEFGYATYQQRRVLRAVDELSELVARPDGAGLTDPADLLADLSAFIRENRLIRRSVHELPARTWTTLSHGDLHGGNVLVYHGKRPAPTLIDASAFGRAHWATDLAWLAADLLLRSVDVGAESYFFTRFDDWRALAGQVGDLTPPLSARCPTSATAAALAALNCLVMHLRACCKPLGTDDQFAANHWEWRLALVSRLLRNSCHSDVSAQKRTLAVVAAHDQLLAASQKR